jgi:ATP-dependent Clp protease ATP-binding subunit ClpA
MQNSSVINLAWQLACVETAAAKAPFIEPDHLLAALTKLRQFCTGAGGEALAGQGADLGEHRPDMQLVADVLDEVAIEADAFRHELRERLGKGTHGHAEGQTIHRSERSRKVFARAAALAGEMKSAELRAGHLFLAILEERASIGCRLLLAKGANLKTLAEKTNERLEKEPAREQNLAPNLPYSGKTRERSSSIGRVLV